MTDRLRKHLQDYFEMVDKVFSHVRLPQLAECFKAVEILRTGFLSGPDGQLLVTVDCRSYYKS